MFGNSVLTTLLISLYSMLNILPLKDFEFFVTYFILLSSVRLANLSSILMMMMAWCTDIIPCGIFKRIHSVFFIFTFLHKVFCIFNVCSFAKTHLPQCSDGPGWLLSHSRLNFNDLNKKKVKKYSILNHWNSSDCGWVYFRYTSRHFFSTKYWELSPIDHLSNAFNV